MLYDLINIIIILILFYIHFIYKLKNNQNILIIINILLFFFIFLLCISILYTLQKTYMLEQIYKSDPMLDIFEGKNKYIAINDIQIERNKDFISFYSYILYINKFLCSFN